jgi:acyl-[acyl-carrier-protein]-phospholipid O-acyltransferase/long-chain-fatty-acid--[acyl-carrier-protein] ligase
MDNKEGIWGRLFPLAATQFLGVFNDHAFKMVIVLTAVGAIQNDYASNAAFLAVLTIVYSLPFITFSDVAGYLADRFSKKQILVGAKTAELLIMLLGTVGLYMSKEWSVYPLIFVMFLMAAQSAFFSPSFNGLLPELFPEKVLSKANGNVGMVTFIAVICGAGGGFLLKGLMPQIYFCGLFFSALSVVGLITSICITSGRKSTEHRKWSWNIFAKYIEGFNYIRKRRALFLSILGEALFVAVGTGVQAVLVIFAIYRLGIPGEGYEISLGLLQVAPALGMGVGCYLAGRFSAGKVELGLVPFGAFGMVIFFLTTALFPGSQILIGEHIVYPLVLISLTFVGIAGGLFVIPLRTYQQQKTPPEVRGTVLANANVICFLAIILTGVIMFLLTSGPEAGKPVEATAFLSGIRQYCFSIPPVSLLVGIAFLTLAASVYTFWLLPDFFMRFLILILVHTVYKLKVKGAENIPEKGPALLIANHVSFIDGLLITTCSSRIVRFLMHEDFYNHKLIHPFVKWAGLIPVPDPRKPKKIIETFKRTQEALRRGEVVCVFPEGKITKNGLMNEFKNGVTRMIPEEMDVPIIPVRLGMIWGSIFSYYYGKIKIRMPKELPHPASVTIGKPVSNDTTPFQMRQIISELAAETEMEPRRTERTLHYQLSKNAKRHPFKKIIKDFEGRELSNFMLYVGSIILSKKVRKLAPDSENIGILLPNTTATAAITLGTMMADKVPAMLNFTASKESLESAMEKAEIKCIITSKVFIKKAKIEELPSMVYLEDIAKGISKSERILTAIMAAVLPHQEVMNIVSPKSHRDLDKTGVIIFSSGSTGTPKGVMLSHHNINSNVHSFIRVMGLRKEDKFVGNLPLFHSFGINTCFWLPIMTGTEIVYLSNPLDAASVGKATEKHGLTILLATPTFLQAYMRKCTSEQLKTLRFVVTGAEKLRADIAEKFQKMTGLLPVEGYGCTELAPAVSINVANSILDIGIKSGKPGTTGSPLPGVCVKIANPDTMEPLPNDSDGLLLVKGPNVMKGYINDPEKTAEVLVDGWYNTGDIAQMNTDGYITITGRLSRFSKIAGEMVPHEKVEAAMYEVINTDERCLAVCGAPDKAKGEKLVIVYTELPVETDKLIEGLRSKELPNLWIPKPANFKKVESLPLLGSGKLDLKAVQKMALDEREY